MFIRNIYFSNYVAIQRDFEYPRVLVSVSGMDFDPNRSSGRVRVLSLGFGFGCPDTPPEPNPTRCHPYICGTLRDCRFCSPGRWRHQLRFTAFFSFFVLAMTVYMKKMLCHAMNACPIKSKCSFKRHHISKFMPMCNSRNFQSSQKFLK